MNADKILTNSFFNRDACLVAKDLLGKVIYAKHGQLWLSAMIIETEAYYKEDRGSHAWLGYTDKRRALFMPAGTIYMYYARGADSFNVSCQGAGNAVLIKSGKVYQDQNTHMEMLNTMQRLNPLPGSRLRPVEKLCSGQTLLCKSLNLKVKQWDQQQFNPQQFFITDMGYLPEKIIQTSRLGIPKGRDEHLPYRFIDYNNIKQCSKNPLTIRKPDSHLCQEF